MASAPQLPISSATYKRKLLSAVDSVPDARLGRDFDRSWPTLHIEAASARSAVCGRSASPLVPAAIVSGTRADIDRSRMGEPGSQPWWGGVVVDRCRRQRGCGSRNRRCQPGRNCSAVRGRDCIFDPGCYSITRLVAIYSGKGHWVTAADHNAVYTRVSTALDVVGLIGAAGAAKETVATARALGEVNGSFREGLGALSRQQRMRFTQALELQGSRRVAAARINLVLKLKLLDAFGAVYGTSTSAYSGVVHDIVVFIVHPAERHP